MLRTVALLLAIGTTAFALETFEEEGGWNEVSEPRPDVYRAFDMAEFHSKNLGLSAQLEAVNPIVDLTENDAGFQLTFTVFNPTESDKKILKWATPLDTTQGHIHGNVFDVRNSAGEKLEYTGLDVKRAVGASGEPPAAEFVDVPKGSSVTARVNPATAYAWPADGYYYIRVRQPNPLYNTYTDVMRTFTKVYLKNVAAQTARAGKHVDHLVEEGEGAMAPKGYIGCSSAKKAALVKWHEDARDKINAAAKCTESNSCRAQVDKWFGAITQSRFADKVTQQFTTMQRVLDSTTYVCDNSDIRRVCSRGGIFAFVYPVDRTQKVFMCDFTFQYPDYTEKVQTVMHELSHFNHIGATDDTTYGEGPCQSLARRSPDKAVRTADNVGYFGKYQPGPFRNGPGGGGGGPSPPSPSGPTPTPPPAQECKDKTCADLKSRCGEQFIAEICPETCGQCPGAPPPAPTARRRRRRTPSSRGDDSCRYAKDGECDEPLYCRTGTDSTDCGRL